MNILLAAPDDGHSSLYLRFAFERLGHNITQWDYRRDPSFDLVTLSKDHDLTVVLKGEFFTAETLRKVHPCALWNFDLWYTGYMSDFLHGQAEAVDYFFTPSTGLFPKGIYLPEAADLAFHRPSRYTKELAADVTFIGTVKDVPGRDEWLEEIGLWCDKNKKVLKIWGSFPGERSKRWHQGRAGAGAYAPTLGPTSDSEDAIHNSIVSSSKVVLDRQRNPEIEGAMSARVFRTMAAKGLVLMRHCKGQEELLGLRNGWNCLTYEKDEECIDLIEAALRAEERYKESHILEAQNLRITEQGVFNERGIQVDARAVLARHGYETVEARHQWVQRAKQMLEHIEYIKL